MLIFVMDRISAIDLKLVIQVWKGDSALCVVALAHNLAMLVQVWLTLYYPKHILLYLDDVDV